jgi:hypothetical protein
MAVDYNIWNKWGKLNTVLLGDFYKPNFFHDIKNNRIRSALTQIAEEIQEDLENFESVLKEFGCEVMRPEMYTSDNIMNYINSESSFRAFGIKGIVPKAPLMVRDHQLVMGNDLIYVVPEGEDTFLDSFTILKSYNKDFIQLEYLYKNKEKLLFKKWPLNEQKEVSDIAFSSAPNITVVGKDVYIEAGIDRVSNIRELKSDEFRFNVVNIDGHNDGCFHTINEGAILSVADIQTYENTFPGWDVCYLPEEPWDLIGGFITFKNKVKGKWWVPGQEDNDEFVMFVETWLQDWVGYIEESVFDVNVLVLDEHHVCVSNINNKQVNSFLKKHNMEPVHIPWRHRFFIDGGLHCITLDLNRDGEQQDYFPQRRAPIIDKGYPSS